MVGAAGKGGDVYSKVEDQTHKVELLHGWVARKVNRWYHLSGSLCTSKALVGANGGDGGEGGRIFLELVKTK